MTLKSWRLWLLLFGIATAFGLLNFSTIVNTHWADGEPINVAVPLVNEMSGSYTVLLLLPFFLWFMLRVPINRANWPRAVPIHVVASMVFGVCHTLLMTVSREWIYPIFLGKPYRMGDPLYRFVMEYHKQVIGYSLTLCVVHIVSYYRRARERERIAAELELQAARLKSHLAEAQMQSLKGQLQPHFLFNTLNMISSVMYDDPEKADRMISRLSTMLRKSLEDSGQQKSTLRQEQEFLDLYLDIMKERFGERLNVKVHIDPELQQALVPSLLLQPLVENAIKHNDLDQSDSAVVRVDARREDAAVVLEVQDNGPGFPAKMETKAGNGVGLSNTLERLQRLYGDRGRLDTVNLPEGGASVRVQFPLEWSR